MAIATLEAGAIALRANAQAKPTPPVPRARALLLQQSGRAGDLGDAKRSPPPTSKSNIAQASDESQTQSEETMNPPEEVDPDFIVSPRIVPNDRVPPLLTILPLNGVAISHLTEWELAPRYLFGDRLTDYFTVEALYAIDSDVRQALTRDNVFISDQRGEYLQMGTVSGSRQVVLRQEEPVTLEGIHIQQSFTGTCRAVNKLVTDIEEQCTFTPALVVDPESIDPDFLFPARIEQPGSLGDVISPETLEILRLPGFQNEGVNGEVVGLDLLFPNVGALPNPEQTGAVDRREQNDVLPSLTFSRVRQVVKANHESAELGRTIHGFTGIFGDREFGLNSAVQGAAQALPDFVPDLKGSDEPTNPNVNKTLFISANNTRLPAESFTAYHGGIGRAKHQLPGERVPPAQFHGVWLGLSPVTERSLIRTSQFAN
ncbi:MAG: hypothetical protein AAFX40_15180, partial [Cyanobacteria bacterium J06639_1]